MVQNVVNQVLGTPKIKNNMFECRKTEHVAQFTKVKKTVVEFILRKGEKELAMVVAITKNMAMQVIVILAHPTQVSDPTRGGDVDPQPMIHSKTLMLI